MLGRATKRLRDLGLPFYLLLAAVVAFTAGWTWFDWTRYAAFNLAIYDLGLNYQLVWSLAHGANYLSHGSEGIHPYVTFPIDILFAPFLPLFPSEGSFIFALLLLQSGFLAIGALVIYATVVERFHDRWAGLGLGLAYLAVPAICGPVWFPFHFEGLFPTLFLLAYWQEQKGHHLAALGLWTLSLATNIGAPLVVAAFGLGLLVEPWMARRGWWDRLRHRPRPDPAPSSRGANWRALYLVGASAATFLLISIALLPGESLTALLTVFTQNSSAGGGASTSGTATAPWAYAGYQLATVLLLLGPLLFLPLWGRAERWALIPFFAHVLLLGNPSEFLWPFTDQYASFVLPGLFVASIRALERPWGRASLRPSARSEVHAPLTGPPRRRWRSPRSATNAVLVGAVLTGVVFSTWGPVNLLAPVIPGIDAGYYHPGAQIVSSPAVDAQLETLIRSVPSDGVLLVQNNLVQALGRWGYYVPGYYNDSHPVNYVLTDPYNVEFTDPNNWGPVPVSMLEWANHFLGEGYGVRGTADGALLLAENWSGPPTVYVPLVQSFSPTSFRVTSASEPGDPGLAVLTANGPKLPVLEDFGSFCPGTYNLTVEIGILGASPSVQLEVVAGSYGGSLPVAWFNATVPAGVAGSVASVSFAYKVDWYFPGMNFLVHIVGAPSGAVTFDGLSWTETGP